MDYEPGPGPFYEGTGCERCRDTGYRGRVGLFELLVLSSELRELILAKRSSQEIERTAVRDMLTIRQDGSRKVNEGVTTMAEIMRVALTD